jgi:hypothetical protein
MMNPTRVVILIAKSLVEEENPFSFYDGYQNLQRSTTQHGKLNQYEFF